MEVDGAVDAVQGKAHHLEARLALVRVPARGQEPSERPPRDRELGLGAAAPVGRAQLVDVLNDARPPGDSRAERDAEATSRARRALAPVEADVGEVEFAGGREPAAERLHALP